MTPLAIGIVWAGYTLTWYGLSLLKNTADDKHIGIGIVDLIVPSRQQDVSAIVAQWK